MLERHDQNAIGKGLRAVYAHMPNPMMPDGLNDLLAKLLEAQSCTSANAKDGAEVAQPYFRNWQRA
jgi:hypothetical protein